MEIKCIYCLKEKPPEKYKKREHVMPQCYGTFSPDNLILYQTVCDECNQYFGEEIELYLGRDTMEGVERYRYGIKPRKLPERHARLKFKISEGELKGMIIMPGYSASLGEKIMVPLMQVGFFEKKKKEYDYFEPQDIPTARELKKQGYDLENKKICLIAKNREDMTCLSRVLKEKGMDIRPLMEIEWPKSVKDKKSLLAVGTINIDRVIFRGLSKIGFNYLAYVLGKEFALLEDFNGIRNFIRYDKGNSDDFFAANAPPILYFDRILKKYNMKVTNGHLIIVEWRGMDLICRASIFNMNTYSIKLCKNFKGILWRPIRYGHHFDVDSKEISNLIAGNSQLIP